jgi:hypothetical protein
MIKTPRSIACLLPILLVSSAFAQESSRADFEELCNAMKGRWVGKVTWVADWPGLGKKGETATCYWEGKLSQDGNVLIGRFVGGEGSAMSMAYFNPATKKIEGTDVDSAGSVNKSVMYKENGKWTMKGEGSLPDGTKTEFTSIANITGDKWIWEGTGKVGDEATDGQHDVWTRLSDK